MQPQIINKLEVGLILTKPHANMNIQTEVLNEFLKRNPNVVILALKRLVGNKNLIEKHYEEHKHKPFFPELVQMFEGKEFYALAILGSEGTIRKVRENIGSTDPRSAKEGTIRNYFYKKYGGCIGENYIHASATPKDGIREVLNFFPELKEKLEALGINAEAYSSTLSSLTD